MLNSIKRVWIAGREELGLMIMVLAIIIPEKVTSVQKKFRARFPK